MKEFKGNIYLNGLHLLKKKKVDIIEHGGENDLQNTYMHTHTKDRKEIPLLQ